MLKYVLCLFSVIIILFCFGWQQAPRKDQLLTAYSEAVNLFHRAEEMEDEEIADQHFLLALKRFDDLAAPASRINYDSLLFFTRLYRGYIYYILGENSRAKQEYLRAISLKKSLPSIPDSFLFKPYLFTGGIYYNSHEFDSAQHFYNKALVILESYNKELDESQRLFNRLGVMFYEIGNYRQAKNYIEKALSIQERLADDPAFLVNYKINLASLLVKLEEYVQAKLLYTELANSRYLRNEIHHNLGIVYYRTKEPARALDYFRQVNYGEDRKNLDLYYNLSMAFAAAGVKDSMNFYLKKADAENRKWNGERRNATYGLVLKFKADELAANNQLPQAINMYQEAVKQFHPAFNESDPSKNPSDFTAVYSYINLFNTLSEKASAQAALYKTEKKYQHPADALNSYEAAYALADHVERTYDSDEARLFLNKLKHTVHSRPIDICLLLFELTNEKNYLEKAYYFDQRNKASVLAFHVQEMQFRNSLPRVNSLISRESSLRTAITRFSLQALNTTDSSKLSNLTDTVRDLNMELGRLQEKINEEPSWKNIGDLQKLPTIAELGKRLDKNTALLSYHLSTKELVILIIYKGKLDYYKQNIDSLFFAQVDSFKTFLHNIPELGMERSREIGKQLYLKLISPVLPGIGKARRLIIIPDDELNYLPFEALADENGKYLVEELAVQYQFSTALLGAENDPEPLSNILAFAPFNKKGVSDSFARFSILPASEQEVKELPGEILLDTAATKQAFLDKAKNFGIIHLATHANVSSEDPFGSYIAFFPKNDFRLYSAEISNLQLSSAQLVILSACETGTGKLVKGEGLMSLSRAFAYAGCHNIITSLWMAEDLSTSYLSKRLHYYLGKNYKKDEALRKAKVDLLNDPLIDPRLKFPSFWAHLVFIGHYEKEERSAGWIWLIFLAVIAAIIFFFLSGRISKY